MNIAGKRYLDYGSFIKLKFGERVQKVSLDTGFSCPNRDGSKGIGGCSYCNNNSFNPNYCKPSLSIVDQIEQGIAFFARKNKSQKYLAYFQAYTNTYADVSVLKNMYREALDDPRIVGLVIGTRPDCIPDEVIDHLEHLAKSNFVSLEFGVESTLNTTLSKVNRCHTFEESVEAFEKCKNRGIHLGAHLILGLPGESEADLLQHATRISKLPIDTLKLHHLQIVKHSLMAVQYKQNPDQFNLFSVKNYLQFISKFIDQLRPDIIIERFISEAPKDLLIAPVWGLKNFEIVAKIDKYLLEQNSWQGKFYHEN